MDWKYPRHSTIPPPMSFVSLSVKNAREMKGYVRFGPMRTTTLSAYPGRVNDSMSITEKGTVRTVIAVDTALSVLCWPRKKP
jgi:hypothetical protein